ncbi:MAG: class I SAM-dependent methyltransferase [Bacteroidetes bacterium]|nr:class I SAM-dependent methyltransferase [Bacteroidota bacterium]
MSKKVFDTYSKYYDLLYRDKDYAAEADYICRAVKDFIPGAKTLLDLGSGTGKHDEEFSRRGYQTTGVELSEMMHREALRNRDKLKGSGKYPEYKNADIRKINLRKKFDVIVSLFHVINYQTENEDLNLTFRNVNRHLEPNGVFMFDFWYGPAVLHEKPLKRLKIIKDEHLKIKRRTTPFLKINENKVDVKFNVSVKNKDTGKELTFEETHSMRYLFIPEIELLLGNNGMKLVHYEEWMTGKKLTEKSWSAFAAAKLK